MPSSSKGFWITERFTPHSAHQHHVKRALVQTQTKFQRAQVADTSAFGRCLILDGEMQSAQSDEFVYHESLVHPALLSHPAPKDVLIMGGGEGATTREILRHPSVRRCVMVDIDGEVVDFCRKYMEPWHQGFLDDPRSVVIIDDAKKYVEEAPDASFDVIVSDLPTPIESGPAYQLYTIEFYKVLSRKLRPGGLLVLQAASGSLPQIDVHAVLYATLRKVFPQVWPFYAHVPSFDVPWAFLLCGGKSLNPLAASAAKVDAALKARGISKLRFYDGVTHEGLFRIPKHLRARLAAEKRVMTRGKQVFFYK
jgi:spermidine synthase